MEIGRGGDGLGENLHGFWRQAVKGFVYRLDLLELELIEEERRFLGRLFQALVAGIFLFVGFIVLNIGIILIYWRDDPLLVTLGLAGLYLLIGALVGFNVIRKVEQAPAPFRESLRVLRKDLRMLNASASTDSDSD